MGGKLRVLKSGIIIVGVMYLVYDILEHPI